MSKKHIKDATQELIVIQVLKSIRIIFFLWQLKMTSVSEAAFWLLKLLELA